MSLWWLQTNDSPLIVWEGILKVKIIYLCHNIAAGVTIENICGNTFNWALTSMLTAGNIVTTKIEACYQWILTVTRRGGVNQLAIVIGMPKIIWMCSY